MSQFLQRSVAIPFLLLAINLLAQDRFNIGETLGVKPTSNFDISGKGDAPEWNATDWISLEKRKGPGGYATRAKLLYSSTGVYALFSCEDEKITATFQKDFANLWTEDVVELFFWPDESTPLYFEYELSPLDHELVLLVPNLHGKFLGWIPWNYEGDRKVRHAVNVVRDAAGKPVKWLAEFFIPYAVLTPLQNVPPEKGTEWRMNLYRIDHDNESTSWSWKPIEKNFHDYQRFGRIRFQ
jgi:hypothetical protein